MKTQFSLIAVGSVLLAAVGMTPVYAADAASAEALFKSNKCSKCHDVAKSKTGPSFQKVAAKYKGKADAPDTLVKFLTTGPKIKNEDGSEEAHKVIKAKDPAEVKNLAEWVLSQ